MNYETTPINNYNTTLFICLIWNYETTLKPVITSSKIAKNMVKLLEKELPFEDKQKTVRAVIEKVEATPTEATIYGRIPIYEGIGNDLITFNEKEVNVGFKTKDSNLVNLNQHITEKGSEKCENSKKFTSE